MNGLRYTELREALERAASSLRDAVEIHNEAGDDPYDADAALRHVERIQDRLGMGGIFE